MIYTIINFYNNNSIVIHNINIIVISDDPNTNLLELPTRPKSELRGEFITLAHR